MEMAAKFGVISMMVICFTPCETLDFFAGHTPEKPGNPILSGNDTNDWKLGSVKTPSHDANPHLSNSFPSHDMFREQPEMHKQLARAFRHGEPHSNGRKRHHKMPPLRRRSWGSHNRRFGRSRG